MATTTIHTLAYKIVADTRQFTEGITATRKELAAAKQIYNETRTPVEKYRDAQAGLSTLLRKGAIDIVTFRKAMAQLKSEYQSLQPATTKFSDSIAGFSKRLLAFGAGYVTVRGAIRGIGDEMERIDSLLKLSRRTGVGFEDIQSIDLASQLSGVDTSEMTIGIQTMLRHVSEARRGVKGATEDFKGLGIEVRSLGRDSLTAFTQILEALEKMDEATRLDFAQRIFGRSGAVISQLRHTDISQAQQELTQRGLKFTEQDAIAIEKANDELMLFNKELRSLGGTLGLIIAPGISQFTKALNKTFGVDARGSLDQLDQARAEAAKVRERLRQREFEIEAERRGLIRPSPLTGGNIREQSAFLIAPGTGIGAALRGVGSGIGQTLSGLLPGGIGESIRSGLFQRVLELRAEIARRRGDGAGGTGPAGGAFGKGSLEAFQAIQASLRPFNDTGKKTVSVLEKILAVLEGADEIVVEELRL